MVGGGGGWWFQGKLSVSLGLRPGFLNLDLDQAEQNLSKCNSNICVHSM